MSISIFLHIYCAAIPVIYLDSALFFFFLNTCFYFCCWNSLLLTSLWEVSSDQQQLHIYSFWHRLKLYVCKNTPDFVMM